MEIKVHTKEREYPILLEHGLIDHVCEKVQLKGQAFLISDDGVPEKWRNTLQKQFPDAEMYVFPNGEQHKNPDTWTDILKAMQQARLSRSDTVIALGGGVVGDMAGFAAAVYMRGIDYINIPTTTLSQIDSSIGGKTAIDFNSVKNSIGAFHQPKMVLIDPDVLSTLDDRQYHNGMAEAIKEGMIRDPELFSIFEADDYRDHIDEILIHCLNIKKDIVEHDEKETGERKLLNFGHTFGHAYESYYGLGTYLHGECVAMGMMTVLDDPSLKARLEKVLVRLNLPVSCRPDPHKIFDLMMNDKKADHDHITMVQVDQIGHGYLEDWSLAEIRKRLGI